jgi:hypothetical protein
MTAPTAPAPDPTTKTQTERQKRFSICTEQYGIVLLERSTGRVVKSFGKCPNNLSLGCGCPAHTAVSDWLKSEEAA